MADVRQVKDEVSGASTAYVDAGDAATLAAAEAYTDAAVVGLGTGDVHGPASSTNNNFASFNGTTGKTIKDSGSSAASFDAAGAAAAAQAASQPLDADLTALAALAATAGMLSRTGAGAFAVRTLGATSPLTWTNPTGAAGDPSIAFSNQSANQVLAGPTTGTAAAPGFRALVSADMPASGAGSGTVTSVAMTVPIEFAIGGSPVTTSGTLAVTKANQNANLVWAGPTSGGAAAPTFRALVAADIPSLSATYLPLAGGTMSGAITLIDGSSGANTIHGSQDGIYFEPTTTGGMHVKANTGLGGDFHVYPGIGYSYAATSSRFSFEAGTAGLTALSGFTQDRFIESVNAPVNNYRKARGSIASPTVILQNDLLFQLNAVGYDGTNFQSGGFYRFTCIEPTPGPTAMGTQWVLDVAPLGSVTATEVLRAEADTGLSMFGANKVIDQNRTHILRSYTTASSPTLVTGGLTFDSTYNAPIYGGATTLRLVANGHPILTTPQPEKLLDRLSIAPSKRLEDKIRLVYQQLNSAGLLAKLGGLWTYMDPYSEYAAADGLINWITPGTGDCTVTGSVTYTAGQGRTGDGSTGLLNTAQTATVFGASQNDIMVAAYIRTANSTKKSMIGLSTGNRRVLMQIGNSSTVTAVLSNTTTDTYTPASYTGLFQHYRVASTGWKWSLNGAASATITRTSNGIGTGNVTFLGTSDGTGSEFSDGQIAFGAVGFGLWSDTDAAAFDAIMRGTWFNNGVYAVAQLAGLVTAGAKAGDRVLISDANATTFMSTVAGGGANIVPGVYDGTNWKIG